MKLIKSRTSLFVALGLIILSFWSCEYREFADAEYPDQKIYMPAALYNNFMINAVPEARGSSPTPGFPERFKVDAQAGKFNVLLGVYRAGIDNKGSFTVNIAVDTDTISKLLTISDALPAETILLPTEKYSLVSTVEMKDGEELAKFDLVVDLNFLKSNSPDKKYALGVGISSTEREVNKALATTIIVIDTKIMKPTANFTSAVSGYGSKQIKFTNTSVYGVDYSWNFGDNSPASTEKSPSHTYTTAGTYNVTLTTIGITGETDKSVFSASVVVQ